MDIHLLLNPATKSQPILNPLHISSASFYPTPNTYPQRPFVPIFTPRLQNHESPLNSDASSFNSYTYPPQSMSNSVPRQLFTLPIQQPIQLNQVVPKKITPAPTLNQKLSSRYLNYLVTKFIETPTPTYAKLVSFAQYCNVEPRLVDIWFRKKRRSVKHALMRNDD